MYLKKLLRVLNVPPYFRLYHVNLIKGGIPFCSAYETFELQVVTVFLLSLLQQRHIVPELIRILESCMI